MGHTRHPRWQAGEQCTTIVLEHCADGYAEGHLRRQMVAGCRELLRTVTACQVPYPYLPCLTTVVLVAHNSPFYV